MNQHRLATDQTLQGRLSSEPCNWLVLVGLLSVIVLPGCSNSKSGTSADDRKAPAAINSQAAPPIDSNPNKFEKALVDAGVKLSFNAKSGKIESADLSQVIASNELAKQVGSIDSITQLVIRQSSLSAEGWTDFGRLHGLQHLDIRECPLDDKSLETLAANMSRLRSVRLSGKAGNCLVTDAGLEFLSKLDQLKVLALDGVKIGSATLGRIQHSKTLSELYLAGTNVDDLSIGLLTGLTELKKLRLSQTQITGSSLAALSSLALEELDVSECSKVDDLAAKAIGNLVSLKRLNLWSTSIGDAGVASLADLTRLQWLNLDNTKITDATLPWLKNMKELSFLHLGSTAVSDKGLPVIEQLSSLKKLVVTRTQVTQAGVDELQKVMPSLDIQLKYVAGK